MKSIIVKTGLEILDFINAVIAGLVAVTFYLLELLVAGGMAWHRFRREMRAQSAAGMTISLNRTAHSARSPQRLQRNYRVAA